MRTGSASTLVILSLLTAPVVASDSAAKEAAPPGKITWRTIATCQSLRDALPGQGTFFVRTKLKDGLPQGVEVRGCGANWRFRRWLAHGVNDLINYEFYALPFYRPGHFDFLLVIGLDDVPYYMLLAEENGYDTAFEFSTTQGIYFGQTMARDGRWDIYTDQIETFTCANGTKLKDGEYPKLIHADDVCKPEH